MRVIVKLLIDRGVTQAEIRAEIDNAQPTIQQCTGDLCRHTVGQREKSHLRPSCGDDFRIWLDECKLRARRVAETGNTDDNVLPASWREVAATSSTPGWTSSRRSNSIPV